MLLMCLAAMVVVGTSAKAQVTITLAPGWTWIGNPSANEVDLTTAFGSFTPQDGDVIKSQNVTSFYLGGYGWFGGITKLEPGKGYKYFSNRTEPVTFIFGTYPYVDLGLPSGLLWATCNVGADSPEDYGDYFDWGETQPKDYYDWSTYQYCMGSYYTLTKYCNDADYGYNGFTDNLTTLLPEDDAATANWGSDWRMPTEEEFQELIDNTTVTWTTQNGVNGRLFTASNGNSLFLPAAGCRYETSILYAGEYGYYWSSSLYTGNPYHAWYFGFGSGYCGMYGGYRGYGRSVRAVRSASKN